MQTLKTRGHLITFGGESESPRPSSRLTMSSSFPYRTRAALLLTGLTIACGGSLRPVPPAEPAAPAASTLDRMTVRTGEQEVVVGAQARARALGRGGETGSRGRCRSCS